VIFSRSRGNKGRHHKVDDARPTGQAGRRPARDEFGSDDEEPSPAMTSGPYDVSDAPRGVERLDLGSLQIPAVADVEVRVQANPDGEVQQVVLVAGDSALQLGVFAAPRTEGIWDEVRDEIRQQLAGDGFVAEEVNGAYGVELRSQVQTPDGVADIRFVGVDGPRWMVRGVYQGPAAVDPAQAGPLAECLTGLVVDRGAEAMPVREPLPLRLPREAPGQAQQDGDGDGIGVVADEAESAPQEPAQPAAPQQPADAHPKSEQSPRSRRRS
jgi:hypothetical protein